MRSFAGVTLRKFGNLLTVSPIDKTLGGILENLLSYNRVVQLRGKEARFAASRIRLEPVRCFRYRGGGDTGRPLKMDFCAGWQQKVEEALRAAGYDVLVLVADQPKNSQKFEPRWDRVSDMEFRYKQQYVLEQMAANEYGRIDCPPGWGKSFCIKAACDLFPKARFAIATHGVDVIQQIYFDLAARFPSVGLDTSKMKRSGSRIMCYSGKSLHHCRRPVDILIVDEVHEWATDDYMEKLGHSSFRHARFFGFSANHDDRQDKADFELEGVFGPIIAKVSYAEGVENKCVVPIEIHWKDVIMDMDPGDGLSRDTDKERACIWQNEVRNELIAEDARLYSQDDAQVMISVNVIEHAMMLKQLLPDFTLCYAENGLDSEYREWCIKHDLITRSEPTMTSERRQKLKRRFEAGKLKKVIATTVWKRGVDFRQLQVLIRADGQDSRIADTQLPGRTSRLFEGKDVGVIVDYKDQFNKGRRRRASNRRNAYADQGWNNIEPARRVSRSRLSRQLN